ncbi:cobalamin adenosyltransferase [Erythrobacter sp. HI0037]|nr:cobalamin adenosyltransferase [Erythrobacter sp. HI0020]KZY17905.1 cobalamin adenosyltransferase [Erythrobacter sp. HI0038]KZY24387.1 cobalamin adenosyltransferase [Erythrobacter sp. HI0037]
MHTIQTLDLNDTRTIIDAGIAEAERIGSPSNIAVVDAGGCLLAFARMDDAWRGSVDIAISKAWTSRAFDVETKALAKLAQPGADFYGIHASNDGKVMIFAGGVPIKKGETVIGAVGVSGGTGEQDQAVAEAAAQAFARG